ncbi:MAG: nickel pincer cofactor-dependent isomerase, group 22 [Syntrophales bacterium]
MEVMAYPRWIRVRQNLDGKRVDDPYRLVHDQLAAGAARFPVKPGARIAVTAGSRYIANLLPITRAVIDYVVSQGGRPFVVPAMGSHGGATARGQLQVLEEYGVTEKALGVPILSSMEVDQLGTVEGIPVYLDRHAREADGIVVINRVKAHQVFKGEIQSGLNKMLAVGLGKRKGADVIHGSGRIDILGTIGDEIRSRVPVLFGVAILENSYDETREVAVVTPDQFTKYDRSWAKQSRTLMPRIPVRELDLVIVDAMGKDISGSGMDTNVIGFTRRVMPTGQTAVPLAVLGLTEKTEGNAMGVGLADFTTRRLVGQIDYRATYTNVLATGIYSTGRIPVVFESDRELLETLLQKLERPEEARIVRIKDTLHLDSFLATESLLGEIRRQGTLETDGETIATSFDMQGRLDF